MKNHNKTDCTLLAPITPRITTHYTQNLGRKSGNAIEPSLPLSSSSPPAPPHHPYGVHCTPSNNRLMVMRNREMMRMSYNAEVISFGEWFLSLCFCPYDLPGNYLRVLLPFLIDILVIIWNSCGCSSDEYGYMWGIDHNRIIHFAWDIQKDEMINWIW